MKTKIKLILIASLTTLIMSCEKDENNITENVETLINAPKDKPSNEKSSVNRSDFAGLYINEQKEIYIDLVFADKKSLWLDKLNQIKGESISSQHIVIIDSIITEVTSSLGISDLASNTQLQSYSLDLLEITSVEDFKLMFSDMNDYSPIDIASDIGKQEFTTDLINTYSNDFVPGYPTARKKCNCDWTCGDGPNGTTSNCEPTSSGCGFLWAFPCENRDILIS